MPETVSCPECARKLVVPEELLGRLAKCPTCGATFTAGADAPPPAPPPAPRVVEEAGEPQPRRPREEDLPPLERWPRRPDWQEEEPDPGRRSRRHYESHRGGLILALGILGLVVCQIFSPFAWAMGSQDLAAMRAGRMDPDGEGLTRAGQVCGILGTIILLAMLLCGLFLILVTALADSAGR